MTTVPAPGWEELLQRLRTFKGAALFLGRSDSGKSTLVKYLLGELAATGMPVALVDADVGQSSLLPGTVSCRSFRAPAGPHEMRWNARLRQGFVGPEPGLRQEFGVLGPGLRQGFGGLQLSFLGSVTPVPILSLLAAETGAMVLRARQDAQVVLIDSTGLVDGDLGRALKLAKIRAVAPELVVAVAAGDELDHILAHLAAEVTIVRLTPSPLVKRRSPELRIRYRHARLAAHFHDAREHLLVTRRLVFIHHGRPVQASFAPPDAGIVVGLNHGSVTRALGVVVEADADSLVVTTPLTSIRGIDRVVLGDFSFCS